ncbi:MAG TPA: adenosylcobinamide-GDP ribazoletransferase [Anaerovoracaceae bacterium]|nr:adenosylcobinamide-GDP ribazoletransferase [Anaerovoracaceae bacterium]
MKIVTGFFMAWSNFLALPCPYKKWDENSRGVMIALLPSIGAVIGAVWMLLLAIIINIDMPVIFAAFLMMLYPYRVSGFFHLDGFMDCTDAIMSRRPLEDRQRILKDSSVGAFAVIALVMLVLCMYTAMMSGAVFANKWSFFIIPIASRSIASFSVMSFKPIGHSQFAGDYQMGKSIIEKVLTLIQTLIFLTLAILITSEVFEVLAVFAVAYIAGFLTSIYGKNQLGGYSGDIAGMSIVVSELAAVILLIFI